MTQPDVASRPDLLCFSLLRWLKQRVPAWGRGGWIWEARRFCFMDPVFTDHHFCLWVSLLPSNVLTVLEFSGVESVTDSPPQLCPGDFAHFLVLGGFFPLPVSAGDFCSPSASYVGKHSDVYPFRCVGSRVT